MGFTSERRWLRYANAAPERHVPRPDRPVRVQQVRIQKAFWLFIRGDQDGTGDEGLCCGAMTSGWWTPPRWNTDRSRRRSGAATSLGWAELLCIAFPVFLGSAAAPAGGLCPGCRSCSRSCGASPMKRRRRCCSGMLEAGRDVAAARSRADADRGQELLRHGLRGRTRRASPWSCCAPSARAGPRGRPELAEQPLRQVIESVNQTLKGQLDLERPAAVHRRWAMAIARILARILALTAPSGTTTKPASY